MLSIVGIQLFCRHNSIRFNSIQLKYRKIWYRSSIFGFPMLFFHMRANDKQQQQNWTHTQYKYMYASIDHFVLRTTLHNNGITFGITRLENKYWLLFEWMVNWPTAKQIITTFMAIRKLQLEMNTWKNDWRWLA